MRDAVKTSNDNFRIKANIPKEEIKSTKQKGFSELYDKIVQLKLKSHDGKMSDITYQTELKAYDLKNRTTDGFQRLSVFGIVDKLQFNN